MRDVVELARLRGRHQRLDNLRVVVDYVDTFGPSSRMTGRAVPSCAALHGTDRHVSTRSGHDGNIARVDSGQERRSHPR
jgi:hypothetical protein